MQTTYVSAEDSILLRQVLSECSGDRFLEIGIGYGSNLKSVAGRFNEIVGTDIEITEGMRSTVRGRFDIVVADRASSFRESCFDLVAINPPYLPSREIEDTAVDGGLQGFQVPKMFLDDAVRVMKPSGKILLVLSSETALDLFVDYCKENALNIQRVFQKRVFFETLFVFVMRHGRQSNSYQTQAPLS